MAIVSKLTRPYVGSVTVRDAALFLRATTPRPSMPVRLWEPRVSSFVASSRALYAWIHGGMEWHEPVPVTSRERVISFEDLVRLRMIALVRARGISYAQIREAESYARQLTGFPQPFVTEALWTASTDIFMEFEAQLLAITRRGQLAFSTLREFLNPIYHGLSFDDYGVARLWSPHPFVTIDPEIQFGAPCVTGTRVETETLWSFRKSGESPESLAQLYRLSREQIAGALEWEQRVSLAA